jgi:hypothetical protein
MTPLSRSGLPRGRRALPLRRGYSLSALFLLMATIAVMAAMASSLPAWGKIPWDVTTANLVIGFLGGALIGGTIGIHYERRVRSTATGAAVGAAAGLITGLISISQFDPLMSIVQCGVLVTLAILVRMTTPSRPRFKPLPAETPAASAPQSRWSHAHRPRLIGAAVTGCCTLVALAMLIDGLRRADLSSSIAWTDAGARLIVVLVALSLTLYLLATAPRQPPSELQPTRSSPWD